MKETLELNELGIEMGSKGFEVNEIIRAVHESEDKGKEETGGKPNYRIEERTYDYATAKDLYPNRKDYNIYTVSKSKDNIETKPDLNVSNEPLSVSHQNNVSLNVSKEEEE